MPGDQYQKATLYRSKTFTRFILSFFIIVFFPLAGIAQEFSYTRYDAKDGLPSTTVYDVAQDADGFIWFGTENGLSRFDGIHFKTFSTKDGLPDNAILKVYGASNGRVYFSPFTNIPHYFFKDSIYKLRFPGRYEKDLATANTFHQFGNKNIIGGISVPFMIQPNDSLIPLHHIYPGLPELCLPTRVTDSAIIILRADSIFLISQDRITLIGIDKQSNSMFALKNNFKILDTKKYIPSVVHTAGYRGDNLFFAAYNSDLFFFSTISGELLYKLKIEKLSGAFIDNEDNLWVTTLGNGVYRFPSFSFRHVSFSGTNEIFSLAQYDGQVIAGSEFSKVYEIPCGDNTAGYTSKDFSHYIARTTNPTSLSTNRNRIYKLASGNGVIYIGADAFLLKMDKSSKPVFRNIFPVKDIDTSGGQLLVCTSTETLLLDSRTMEIQDTLLTQRTTTGVFYNDSYYIGTLGGLIKISSANKSITGLQQLHPSLKTRIVSIRRGIFNDLWIATSGSGLVNYKDGKIIRVLNSENGITSDICTSLFIDSNNVWLGTNKGLNRIMLTGDQYKIVSFTTANGLAADFINTVFVHDSIVYVGSSLGLTYFNKHLTGTRSVCLLHIMQVTKGNEALKIDSNYSFPYRTLNIRIDFTAISFKSAGEIKYYYKLDGLDTNWNVTNNTFINYATLPSGRYVLMISAENKFGVKSDTKTIVITIRPAWWQTWWFISVASLGIAGIVLLLFRRNIRAIRKQEENKRNNDARFAALEQQALQAQMNPHFIFNCLNSIQSYILDLDAEGANKYLSAFASMIRQTLDNSSTPLISLASEIKYLETYLQLEKMRFKDKFNYSIHVEKDLDPQNLLIPGMLLQPYIENSLRHGIQHRNDNRGLISLEIKEHDTGILCLIKDNGIGRKKAEEMKSLQHIEYQSKGTFINQKRISVINQQFKTNIVISTEDVPGDDGSVSGTVVKLFIPEFNTHAT